MSDRTGNLEGQEAWQVGHAHENTSENNLFIACHNTLSHFRTPPHLNPLPPRGERKTEMYQAFHL
jgi:hypothetical protein